jgi:arylsulfatase
MSAGTFNEEGQKPQPPADSLSRREVLMTGTAAVATAGLVSTAAEAQTKAPAQQSGRRPNILFFHVDNTGVGDWGPYGGAYALGAKTPTVDRFASEGLLLRNYAPEAQCTPTRSALMTGRHSIRTGCFTALPGSGLVAWEVTVAEKLKELGYSNACLGKWHCGEDVGRLPTDHGFDYWYGIAHSWDEAYWPEDKFFKAEGLEPAYILESRSKGDLRKVKVLDMDVRRDIDLELMDKALRWMEDAKAKDQPFFLYFNHSNIHLPVLPRAEYKDKSNGGPIADCIQMVDGDFKVLLDKIDALGQRDNTIVIFAGDNGRDDSFHAPGNRGSSGPWRGGYFSTWEGNNHTAGMIRWPGQIQPGKSDEMVHVTDWFPTLLNMIGHPEKVPTDRVIDGIDQSAFVTGKQTNSNRNYYHMYFDKLHVGMRYKNFKVLTHKVENGLAAIQQLAIPNIYNLTVNPDEDMPLRYEQPHSWVLFNIYPAKTKEFYASLAKDSVPFGAPLDFNPYKK